MLRKEGNHTLFLYLLCVHSSSDNSEVITFCIGIGGSRVQRCKPLSQEDTIYILLKFDVCMLMIITIATVITKYILLKFI